MRNKELLSPDNVVLVEGFATDCKLRNLTTADNYQRTVIRYLLYLQNREVNPLNIKKSDLKAYLLHLREDKHLIHRTLEHIFAHLNCFYSFLADEELITVNPIPEFRKRNLKAYKASSESQQRQSISILDAAMLISSTLETRDRAILLLLFKTGIRNHELLELDINDIDLGNLTLIVKPAAKRSNRELYFDPETAEALRLWLNVRSTRKGSDGPALFLNQQGNRLTHDQLQYCVEKHAARIGLHDPNSKKLADRFTPHCCRHWFTTHLISAGMPRDFVKELRGDARREAIDIYNHIDKKELKARYLKCIPQLGI